MFGDTIINGESILNLKNNEIKLPSFTHVLNDNSIYILYMRGKEKIVVCSKIEFESIIEEWIICLTKYFESKNMKNMRANSQAYHIINKIFIYDEIKIKKGKIIKIPAVLCENLLLKDSVYVIGNENRLEIYKDKKTYILTKKNK